MFPQLPGNPIADFVEQSGQLINADTGLVQNRLPPPHHRFLTSLTATGALHCTEKRLAKDGSPGIIR